MTKNMKNKYIVGPLIIVVIIIAGYLIIGGKKNNNEIRIGVSIPLTGKTSYIGEQASPRLFPCC